MLRCSPVVLLAVAVCCCSLVAAVAPEKLPVASVGKRPFALELPPDAKKLLGAALSTVVRVRGEFCGRTGRCVEKDVVVQHDAQDTKAVVKRLDTAVVALLNALRQEQEGHRGKGSGSSAASAAAEASEAASLNAARSAMKMLQAGNEGGLTDKEVVDRAAEQAGIAMEEAQKAVLYAAKVRKDEGTNDAMERAKAVQSIASDVDVSIKLLQKNLEKDALKELDIKGTLDTVRSSTVQGAVRALGGKSGNLTNKVQDLASATDGGSIRASVCSPALLLTTLLACLVCAAL